MEINLHNYEAFFLDHKEGNLDVRQEKELFAFLEMHPELKAELDSFDLDSYRDVLEPEALFENKASLKKNEYSDEALIAYTEGLSDEKAAKGIEKLAAENASFNKELTLYKSAILAPDHTIKFPGKSKLRRGGAIIYLQNNPAFLRAAAAILLLLGLFFLVSRVLSDKTGTGSTKQIVNKDQNKEITAPQETKDAISPEKEKVNIAVVSPERNVGLANKEKNNVVKETRQPKKNDAPRLVAQTTLAVNSNGALPTTNKNDGGSDTLLAQNKNFANPVNTATNTVTYKAWYNYEVDTDDENRQVPVTASAAPAKKTFFQKVTAAAKRVNAIGVKKVDAKEEKEKSSLAIGGLVVTETVSN